MSGVLVTGATTPFGIALVRALLDAGAGTRVLAVGREHDVRVFPDHPDLTYLATDLSRSRDLRGLLFGPVQQLGIRAVVHGPLHRVPSRDARAAHQLDVECTREMLHLLERVPCVSRFVYRSTSNVYAVAPERADLVSEEDALDLDPASPQWVRDRVEGDLVACTRMGLSRLSIAVLRFAEVLEPGSGSQLLDYLGTTVCLRPLGFDPMVQVLSLRDAVRATRLALASDAQGVFNVPGRDTLPLSRLIAHAGRVGVALPSPLLPPLYALRVRFTGRRFHYPAYAQRFHKNVVLDGHRARDELGYEPQHGVDWNAVARGA